MRRYHQDLSQAGEEYGVQSLGVGPPQIVEPGSKHLLGRRGVASFRRELSLEANAVCVVGAQTMPLSFVLEPGDRTFSDVKAPEPKRDYASTPCQRETQ